MNFKCWANEIWIIENFKKMRLRHTGPPRWKLAKIAARDSDDEIKTGGAIEQEKLQITNI